MPELPEVETVVRGLRSAVGGRSIGDVEVNAPKASVVVSPSFAVQDFAANLRSRTVLDVTRRGKNILMQLSGDVTLWVHLKMTGNFFWVPADTPREKHDLVVFSFRDSLMELRFNDYRRFGRLRLYRTEEVWQQKGLKELGPEPLEITAEEFVTLCRRRGRQIKLALLDQSFLAGIGNIYADESLYATGIHPLRLTTNIPGAKLVELHGHFQRLLKKAIRMMGTSVDNYAGVNGKAGRFQNYLKVYSGEGNDCVRCGTSIVRMKIGSRSAHFCPKCQRSPRRQVHQAPVGRRVKEKQVIGR